jgi:hypothetical protein
LRVAEANYSTPYFLGGNSLNRESTHALGILFRFPVLFFERTLLDAVGGLVSLGGASDIIMKENGDFEDILRVNCTLVGFLDSNFASIFHHTYTLLIKYPPA